MKFAFHLLSTFFLICLPPLSGCRTGSFTPQTLPPQFLANRPPSVRAIDLIGLSTAGPGGDILQIGDTVEVIVATGLEDGPAPKYELRVSQDTTLDVPLIGAVDVRNARPTDSEAKIRQAAVARGLYIDPKLTVRLIERQSNRVTVAGAVMEPATYQLPVASSDLLASLTAAKGFALDADTVVEIRHPSGFGPQIYAAKPSDDAVALVGAETQTLSQIEIDLTNIDKVPREHMKLYDGSVVTVKRRVRSTISVMGLVRKPGVFEMPDDEPYTLLDAISEAGGTTLSLADRVQIIRRTEGQMGPIVIEASVRDSKFGGGANLELAAGDIVTVEETPTTFILDTFRSLFNIGLNAGVPGL